MRLAVDHLCVHPINTRKIVNEVAFGLGHRGQDLYTLVRRHELSKRLFHELDEFSVMPGKGHEFVRIHNVAIRFVNVRIDAKRFSETSVAFRYLALIRTVWGKGSLAPSWS